MIAIVLYTLRDGTLDVNPLGATLLTGALALIALVRGG